MTYTFSSRAFSLVEVTMVIALLTGISLFITGVGTESFSRAVARDDVTRIETLLRYARSSALARACRNERCFEAIPQHGVRIENTRVLTFEGSRFSSTTVHRAYPLSVNSQGATTTFLFFSGIGDVSEPGTLILHEQTGIGRYLTVNAAGMIERGLSVP